MAIVASRREGLTHDVTIGDRSLVADEPPEQGGNDEGPRPVELLAAALASCTSITVAMYADRKGWELDGLSATVEVEGSLVKGDARYEVILELPGGLSEEQTQRITAIAAKCPVHKALAKEMPITISNRIRG
jgi:putative redox protein